MVATPAAADQHLAAAIAAHQSGQRARAETLYLQSLELRPADAHAHYLLGALYFEMRVLDRARDALKRALALKPGHDSAQSMLGAVYSLKGEPLKAVAQFRAVAERAPSAENALNYARALREANDDTAAARAYDDVLVRAPSHPEALIHRANYHLRAGEFEQAEVLLRRLIIVSPDDPVAKTMLGSVLHRQGRLDDAETIIRTALAASPDNPDVLMSLGLVLDERGNTADAIALHRRAAALKPDLAEAWNNLGFAQQHAGDYDAALSSYDRALALKPDFHGAQTNKAFTLLTLGRLREGWDCYRHRFDQKVHATTRRVFTYPEWDGRPDKSATVLLWTDQGLGDEVLYASMLNEARARVGRCILVCTAKMVALFQRSFPDVTVLPDASADIAAIKADYQLSLAELGAVVRPSLDTIPHHHGYLKADLGQRAALRAKYHRVAQGKKLVGVSWQSDTPRYGVFKTMPLDIWAPILAVPGVQFVSLQYGRAVADAAGQPEILRDDSVDAFRDPDASAAQIAAMDLVITVSNTTAHFAGGLGVPVWTLASRGPGALWYWLTERVDSPWYPSMRILRQPAPGDWAAVAADAARRLNVWVSS